jgi:HSP90 family molecular chaperone
MAKVPFKVSARAGKLLGRENFSNPEGAIIELVKNSYDADAKNCLVFFDIPTSAMKDSEGKIFEIPIKEESTLYILDNGEG